jgi:tRNA threonylcarbamoyladenosine biosynthesis protein TsaB
MKLLAIETATEACSVAVLHPGGLLHRFEIAPRRHAELALPWAEALLAEAGIRRRELDCIAVGIGPGAFTGVRLAVALGQGLARALDRPLIGVSTLAVLAAGSRGLATGSRVFASIDARMAEVYAAEFELDAEGLPIDIGRARLGAPAAIELPSGPSGHARGTGLAAVDAALGARLLTQGWTLAADALPHAEDLARIAARRFSRGDYATRPEDVQPVYLREKVAQTIAERAGADRSGT